MGKKKNGGNQKNGRRAVVVTPMQRKMIRSLAQWIPSVEPIEEEQEINFGKFERDLLDIHKELVSRLPNTPTAKWYADTISETKGSLDAIQAMFISELFPHEVTTNTYWAMLSSATEVLVSNEFKKNKWDRLGEISEYAAKQTNWTYFPLLNEHYLRNNEMASALTMNDIATLLMVGHYQRRLREIVQQIPESDYGGAFDYDTLDAGEIRAVLAPIMDRKLIRQCKEEAIDFVAHVFGEALEGVGTQWKLCVNHSRQLQPDLMLEGEMLQAERLRDVMGTSIPRMYAQNMTSVVKKYFGTAEEVTHILEKHNFDFRRILAGLFFWDLENPCLIHCLCTASASLIAYRLLPQYEWRYLGDNEKRNKPIDTREIPENPRQTKIRDEILDILYKSEEIRNVERFGRMGTATNAQMIGTSGITMLCPETTLLDRAEVEERLDDLVRRYNIPSDAELGALVMLNTIMCSDMFSKDEALYEEQAAKIQEMQANFESKINGLQSENNCLRSELIRNANNEEDTSRLLHEKDETIARLQRQLEGEQQEKEEIRSQLDTVLSSLEAEPEEDVEEEEIQYPIDVADKNVYLFGGFPAFHRNVLENLPGIHISSVDRKINESTIHNASLVVLQINHMSHPTFYKLSSACDAAKIPWIALRSGGVDQSCKQILGAIERLGI